MAGFRGSQKLTITAGVDAANAVDIRPAAVGVFARVNMVALSHRATGHYMNALSLNTQRYKSVEGFVKEHVIVSNDAASIPIEYGHQVVYRGRRTGTYVPGQYIFTRAFASIAKV